VGLKFYVDGKGPVPKSIIPDPIRNLGNAGFSTSPEIRACTCPIARAATVRRIGASAYAARAFMCRNIPPLSNYFAACAKGALGENDGAYMNMTRDDMMWTTGVGGEASIQSVLAASVTGEGESFWRLTTDALGLPMSTEEEAAMMSQAVLHPPDGELARALLPASWLAALEPTA